MSTDTIHALVAGAVLVLVVAAIYGALWLYEKKTGRWPGSGGTSSSDSMNDIINSID